jgi:hypothetical protein
MRVGFEVELMSPLQLLKISREVFAVTFDGLFAEMLATVFGVYHSLGVVDPVLGSSESKY